MRPIKILSLAAATIFGTFSIAEDASGQGIVRRFLQRRGVVAPRQPAPAANNPAAKTQNGTNQRPASRYQSNRPATPPSNAQGAQTNPAQTSPSAQYRSQQGRRLSTPGYGTTPSSRAPGNVTRIPAQGQPSAGGRVPTLAAPPSQVAQTSANEPASGNDSGFGQSILKPLDFEAAKPPPKNNSATLGIQAVDANPGYPGVKILQFKPYSTVDDAGLSVGDFIFAIDGVATPSVGDLAREVAKYSPGQEVRFRVGMDGRVSDVDIKIAARPNSANNPSATAPPASRTPGPSTDRAAPAAPTPAASSPRSGPQLGADVRDIDGMRGVIVTDLEPGAPAALSGIKLEDRIIAINGLLISGTPDLVGQLRQLPADEPIQVRLIRDSQLMDTTVSFDGPSPSPIASSGQPTPASASGAAKATKKSGGGSLLGGFGSILGGVFGGESSKKPAEPTPAPAKTTAQKVPIELPTPPVAELLPPAAAPEPVQEPASEPSSSDGAALQAEIQRLKDQLKSLEDKVGP